MWSVKKCAGHTALAFVMVFFAIPVVNAKPDVVSADRVTHCRYLTTVSGFSGYGKNPGWQPLAKNSAEHKAEALGATHVVWEALRPIGAFNGEAVAKVYTCNESRVE